MRGKWDGWRVCSAIGTGALLPITVLAWIIVFTRPAYSRCLMYGEQCNPDASLLGTVAWWAFWASLVAGVVALVLPVRARRFRPVPMFVQLLLMAAVFGTVVAMA